MVIRAEQPQPTVASEIQIGRMRRLGIPQTKAGYLFLWSLDNPLRFPLDVEFEMTVPLSLDGELPNTWDEYFRMTKNI